MGATVAVKNAMLDAVTVTQMSLHSGDPGDTVTWVLIAHDQGVRWVLSTVVTG